MKKIGLLMAFLLSGSAFAAENFVCSTDGYEAAVSLSDAGVSVNLSVGGEATHPVAQICNVQGGTIHCAATLNSTRYEIYPTVIGSHVTRVAVLEWSNTDVIGRAVLENCHAVR